MSKAKFRLYQGGRGSGKTTALLMECIYQSSRIKGSRGIIFRRTMPRLERYIINRFVQMVPRDVAVYHANGRKATFVGSDKSKPYSELYFAHCEHTSDIQNHFGQEYDYIAVDELEEFDFPEFWHMVLGCLRSTNVEHKRLGTRPNFFATAMPSGIGEDSSAIIVGKGAIQWIREHFIDRTADYGNIPSEEFWSIHATVEDNPTLYNADPDYVRALEALTGSLRDAWRYGKWDSFEGQYFKGFDLGKHVILPLEWKTWHNENTPHGILPDPSLPPEARAVPFAHIVRGIDYGFHDPFVCLWAGIDRAKNVWFYKEYSAQGFLARDNAKAVAALTTDAERRILRKTICPPDMWAKRGESANSPYEEFRSVLKDLEKRAVVEQADTDRVTGWYLMSSYIGGDGVSFPRFYVTSDCKDLIRSIRNAVHDPRAPEDIAADDTLDHWLDAARYLLMSRGRPSPIPRGRVVRIGGEDIDISNPPPGTLAAWFAEQMRRFGEETGIGHYRLSERLGETS